MYINIFYSGNITVSVKIFLPFLQGVKINCIFTDNACILYLSCRKLSNCREKTETNVSLIAYNCVLDHVRAHRFLPFTLHAPSIRKAMSWSVTVYNKTLSSQCNVTAPTEPAQDKKEYLKINQKIIHIYQCSR